MSQLNHWFEELFCFFQASNALLICQM